VLFVNGMPLVIVELKRAGAASTGVAPAHAAADVPARIPDGVPLLRAHARDRRHRAKYGTPFTPLNHFAPWNVDDDGKPLAQPRIEDGVSVEPIDDALNGLFNRSGSCSSCATSPRSTRTPTASRSASRSRTSTSR
jgi:type I restriction enzyme R subunit